MTTIPHANVLVSFVIATHNRGDVLLKTLANVMRCGLNTEEFETFVVDNASTDGTDRALARNFPIVHVLPQRTNLGSCAKNVALSHTRGRFIVFLDDDSFPQRGSIERMVRHFQADPKLGAASFAVQLPGGSRECSAYPD